jgi:L-threonylcarbamoyladenylate synthase
VIALLSPTEENLRVAATALREGRLVAFPTETVYGLGGDAMNPNALAQIFEVKQRPFFDPLIVHIADRALLTSLCQIPDSRAEKLMDAFWPGPLTLVLPKKPSVPDLATSGLSTVAIRMPAHPVALKLLKMAGIPVAAPSANPFGRLSPTTAAHVQGHFESGIEMVLDGGPCTIGVESTILSLASETPVLLRAGGLPREEIEALIGPISVAGPLPEKPLAPGQLLGHYAPRTWLRLKDPVPGAHTLATIEAIETIAAINLQKLKPLSSQSNSLRIGLLAFKSIAESGPYAATEILSPTGNLREAAANLFASLHRLDTLGLDWIEAETLPETGLGVAIMDRLRKAAAGSRL